MSTPVKKDLPTSEDTHTGQHPLLGLRQEVDTLFDNFFSNFSLGPFGRYGADFDPFRKLGASLTHSHDLMPSIDVRETEKEFRISAELPGMDEKESSSPKGAVAES